VSCLILLCEGFWIFYSSPAAGHSKTKDSIWKSQTFSSQDSHSHFVAISLAFICLLFCSVEIDEIWLMDEMVELLRDIKKR
jgi:hypothetical protein